MGVYVVDRLLDVPHDLHRTRVIPVLHVVVLGLVEVQQRRGALAALEGDACTRQKTNQ